MQRKLSRKTRTIIAFSMIAIILGGLLPSEWSTHYLNNVQAAQTPQTPQPSQITQPTESPAARIQYGDMSYTMQIVDNFEATPRIQFNGPTNMYRAQYFVNSLNLPVIADLNGRLRFGSEANRLAARQLISQNNIVRTPTAHFSITNQDFTGEIIGMVESIDTFQNPQVDPFNGSFTNFDINTPNTIDVPTLSAFVGDTLVFQDHSIPSGMTANSPPNIQAYLERYRNFQSSGPINTSNFPALIPTDAQTSLAAGWLNETLLLTSEMVGTTTFFYQAADWRVRGYGHVYAPYSQLGGGDMLRYAINLSKHGNHFVFTPETVGGSYPGGRVEYFQALRVIVVEPPSPTPTPGITPTPSPTPAPTPAPAPPPPLPNSEVTIQKIDALTRENIPGALVRLRGMSAHFGSTDGGHLGDVTWSFDNTGINLSQVLTAGATTSSSEGVTSTVTDGVWTITGLPWGFYMVEEERAPDGYSLLPQHTAYGFWLHPPNITINVDDWDVLVTWNGVVMSFREVAEWELPDEITLEDVVNLLETLGENFEVVFGFGISEEYVPSSILITFENYPYGAVEVLKFDELTGEPLSGAHFRIEGFSVDGNASGLPIERTGITDGSGRILFDNLPAGHYTITEIIPPPGYMPPDNPTQSISITWGQTNTINFYNIQKSSLEVQKIDGNTGEPLAGAIFELRDPVTGETWLGTTDTNGIFIFGRGSHGNELIPFRTYILTEIQAPPGYVLISTPQEIILSPGDNNQIILRNYENPGLTIIKRDQDTQELLPGAVFEVVYENGQTVAGSPFTTDGQGRIFIPGMLFEGQGERTLIITEIIPPPGYSLSSPNWQTVTIRAGEDNTVTFYNRRPYLEIIKRDAITGTAIPNAEFTIEKLSQPGAGLLTGNPFRTDENGRIRLHELPPGIYRIIETRAANNYWLDPMEQNRSWTIEIRANEDYTLIIENTLLPSLIITKMNALTFQPVPLTQFRVEFEIPNTGNVINLGHFLTDQNGRIVLPFVQPGWYRVTETRAAPGMSLNVNNSYRIFLAPGQNTYQLIQDGLIPHIFGIEVDNRVEIPQIPEQNEPLPPEIYEPTPPPELSGISPTFDQAQNMTDDEIRAMVAGQISISDGSQFQTGDEVWNWPLNSIIIRKTDLTTGRLLAGATFELIHISAGVSGTLGTVIGTYTTNHTGTIVITGLVPGTYAVRETQAPPNYVLSLNNMQHGFLMPDGHTILQLEFSNHPYGSLLVTLRDEVTGLPLANGEFRVQDSSGAVVGTGNGIFRTNAQGEFLVPNLPPGSFVVTQIVAPNGYTLGTAAVPQTIFIPADGQTYFLDFTNRPYSGLVIRKIDAFDNTPISGVRFNVTRINGELIGEFITDHNGLIEIDGLLGWFVVREIEVPHGFEFDPQTVRNVEIRPQARSIETFVSARLGSLIIEVIDEFGVPLAGATVEVRNQSGTYVGTFITGASGVVAVPNLQSGWYYVEQLQAPLGYTMMTPGLSVRVLPETVARARFVNIRNPGIVIEKVGGQGNPLAGAEFEIRTVQGTLIQRVTTNIGGTASIFNLYPGVYQISESRAPAGFVLMDGTQTVDLQAGQTATLRFVNELMPTIVIEKTDENGNPLAGAVFEVRTIAGTRVAEVITNQGGIATVTGLQPGAYEVIETRAPAGFVLDSVSQMVQLQAGQTATVRFVNFPAPSLIIEKVDGDGNPLANAEFEVRTLDGELVERVVTSQGGMATLPNLEPGTYVVTETRAPPGFVITEPSQTVVMAAGQSQTLRFVNFPAPSLIIEKVDGDGNPLANAEFEVRTLGGELVARVTTNMGGIATVPNISPGAYQIIETRPPPGFAITEPARTIEFAAGQSRTERFVNYRLSTVVIQKVDGETNLPLEGVAFEISAFDGARIQNSFTGGFEFLTDSAGLIRLPELLSGTYVATETRPLPGFAPIEPHIFQVGYNMDYIITIRNFRFTDMAILKIDGDTQQPMAGVQFEIAHDLGNGTAGERLINLATLTTTWTTDNAGRIALNALPNGRFIAIETRTLDGYQLAEPTLFTVETGNSRVITIENFRETDIAILKIDGDTQQPLAGVQFEIARDLGNGTAGERLINPNDLTTTWTTDNAGRINLNSLPAGRYIAIETRPLDGYQLAKPTLFTVETGVNRVITIENFRHADLIIRKINSVTREPIEGVVFEITRLGGDFIESTRVRNPQTGFFDFVTDRNGLIYLPALSYGSYLLTETMPATGFIGLSEPIMFHITPQTRQQEYVLVVENTPASGLLIVKTDGATGEPLAGVEFEIRHADGRLVQGSIIDQNQPSTAANSPQMTATGGFVTDAHGRILLNHLTPGVYRVTEVRALPGYQLDQTVHTVTVTAGHQAVLEVVNHRLAGLRILKVDAVTGAPIYNVEFMIFDQNNNVVGVFYTDNNGLIDLSGILQPGRYTIRETRPAPGYFSDDIPRTIEFTAGQITEIRWENVPMAGQLQITKVSADDNQLNGLPAGTPLQGAVFEIFEYRTGNLVDRIESNNRGIAVSRPLPLGRYFAIEVATPQFYMINREELHFDIEFATQIIRATFVNYSANIGVNIDKTAPREIMQGNQMTYEVRNIRNESSVSLTDFFWRDILPTQAVRAHQLVTGTFNADIRYNVRGVTNLGNEFIIADNLSSARNNVIELGAAHLGFAQGEFWRSLAYILGRCQRGLLWLTMLELL
ncbi:MAG: SpaA isopeptide-forming pilin-related protein [Turicibacter sp.]|nr:SpaA isopeptide-forming pilin-related protein [Turicibacter sp.]